MNHAKSEFLLPLHIVTVLLSTLIISIGGEEHIYYTGLIPGFIFIAVTLISARVRKIDLRIWPSNSICIPLLRNISCRLQLHLIYYSQYDGYFMPIVMSGVGALGIVHFYCTFIKKIGVRRWAIFIVGTLAAVLPNAAIYVQSLRGIHEFENISIPIIYSISVFIWQICIGTLLTLTRSTS